MRMGIEYRYGLRIGYIYIYMGMSLSMGVKFYLVHCQHTQTHTHAPPIFSGKDGNGCGMVVVDHEVQQGAEKRNFEGEEVGDIPCMAHTHIHIHIRYR